MTDIIKDFVQKNSKNVMQSIKNDKSMVDTNITRFQEEMRDLGSCNPTIIAFGNNSHEILSNNLESGHNIKKILHYSHYISKEKYRDEVRPILKF